MQTRSAHAPGARALPEAGAGTGAAADRRARPARRDRAARHPARADTADRRHFELPDPVQCLQQFSLEAADAGNSRLDHDPIELNRIMVYFFVGA